MAVSKQLKDEFLTDNEESTSNHVMGGIDIEKRYEPSELSKYRPDIQSITELVSALESDKTVDIDAAVWFVNPKTQTKSLKRLGRGQFVEAYKKGSGLQFKENIDSFQVDTYASNEIGVDYVPLLGGPFNRQLYLYDMLKAHQQSFYAFHHDPIAKQAVNIIKDFTLGEGFRVDTENKDALAIWRAFEEVNDLQTLMNYISIELSLYGEVFVWELPNLETSFRYNVSSDQAAKRGYIPRLRLIDPSTVWEIVSYPEDINQVLYYQMIYPTQYQIYPGQDAGKPVPTSKYIYRQVLPNEVSHYKINVVSNEKRGRGDLVNILGYLKRMRDTVNFSIIDIMKKTSWSIDTEIDGNQPDIDAYMQSIQALGDFAPPGSEFVHSKKIKRNFLSAPASGSSQYQTFDWVFSMITMGLGIPQSYFATHHTTGQTKASAIVATEPVAKMFKSRQLILEKIIEDMAKKLFKHYGITSEVEVTFPEIIAKDSSARLKDISLAESSLWISKKRAATMGSKELDISNYDYETELKDIASEGPPPASLSPLTSPPVDLLSPMTARDSGR
jgi:hypothetical protein